MQFALPGAPLGLPTQVLDRDGRFELGPMPTGRYRVTLPYVDRGLTLEGLFELSGAGRVDLGVLKVPDLAQLELNATHRMESLRRYLVAHRDNRLFIAVHDPDHLTRFLPRMMDLLGAFGANIAVHRTEGDAARAQDCFVLFDA